MMIIKTFQQLRLSIAWELLAALILTSNMLLFEITNTEFTTLQSFSSSNCQIEGV